MRDQSSNILRYLTQSEIRRRDSTYPNPARPGQHSGARNDCKLTKQNHDVTQSASIMVPFYNNLNRDRVQLRARESHERFTANMSRLRRCCKLVCAKHAPIIVIMLLILRAFKTTCSITNQAVHSNQNQYQHQQHTNQPILYSSRATTNLSSSLNLPREGNDYLNLTKRALKRADHSESKRLNSSKRFFFDDETLLAGRQNYDFLEGLGEFIRLMLDELELHNDHDLATVGSSRAQSTLNPLDDLSENEHNQRLWPPNGMINSIIEHNYGNGVSRENVRNKRDLVSRDEFETVPDKSRKQQKFTDRGASLFNIKNDERIPSNHRRSAATDPTSLKKNAGNIQVIKSVLPIPDVTHMRMVNDNSTAEDHRLHEQAATGLVGTLPSASRRTNHVKKAKVSPVNRSSSTTAATMTTPTTMAPNLVETRGTRSKVVDNLPEDGLETEILPPIEDMEDTTGSELTDGEILDQDVTLIDSDNQASTSGEQLPSLGPQAELPNKTRARTATASPERARRRANLLLEANSVSTQPPITTSSSLSNQVPPPELDPLKETTARGQVKQSTQYPYYDPSDERIVGNDASIFDNETDINTQYLNRPTTNLPQIVPLSDNVSSIHDTNKAIEQQQHQNLMNHLSTIDSDTISNVLKDPKQLMQLLQSIDNTDLSTKKPKKPNRIAPIESYKLNAQRPIHQQVFLEDLIDRSKLPLSSTPSRYYNAPYTAFNYSGLATAGVDNEHHNQFMSTNMDPPKSNQYELISEQQNANHFNFNPRHNQPIQTVYQPLDSSPPMQSYSGHTNPRQTILPDLRSKLEENFYGNFDSNQRHNKRAAIDTKARQLAQQLDRESAAFGGWPHKYVSLKPTRHQSNLISSTAPLSQYLHQAKPLQSANSYLHPSRNDPMQDSSQPESGYQGVAPSMMTQSQVLGMLRAGPAFQAGSRANLVGQQLPTTSSSAQLIRRALPLTVTTAQITGARLPTLPTTAYLLPAFPTPTIPYSGTSSRYTRHLNGGGPSQRLWSGSPHRIGKLASPGLTEESAVVAAATSDPMWSDTQNQEDDYQQAPQTIQITAVPNGLGVNNGFNGFNGGWNGWGGGPWNGRQVLLVNRQPTSEWRNWILPVAAVLSLPLVLGSLLVPVFLKSVMFLIQILQMLGFLMPPGQLAGQMSSISHSPSG